MSESISFSDLFDSPPLITTNLQCCDVSHHSSPDINIVNTPITPLWHLTPCKYPANWHIWSSQTSRQLYTQPAQLSKASLIRVAGCGNVEWEEPREGASCHRHSAHLAETKLAGKIVTTESFYPPGRERHENMRVTLVVIQFYQGRV